MSVSLETVGHHHMNTDSLESVARQLSDAFDINIRCLSHNCETMDTVELGRVVKHPERPFHILDKWPDEEGRILYQLDSPHDEAEGERTHFFYMDIYREMINISLLGWPHRSSHYERCFRENEPPMSEETAGYLKEFRVTCKEVFAKLDIHKVYCFGGGYSICGLLDEDAMYMTGDEYDDYVLSGLYLDDIEKKEGGHWKDHSMIIYVSDFISGKNTTRCKDGADVFIDDFSDIR